MKHYGWNYIGGPDNKLGYKVDDLKSIKSVPIHSKTLPAVPKDASFYVYTGDEHTYKRT